MEYIDGVTVAKVVQDLHVGLSRAVPLKKENIHILCEVVSYQYLECPPIVLSPLFSV